MNSVSGIAAASTIVSAVGHRQALADRRDRIFGIAAAGEQGADRLADQLGGHVLAGRGDDARDFEAGNRGRAGRRRIEAAALQHVGPVDPGRGDLDQHLARRPAAAPGGGPGRAPPARPASAGSIASISSGKAAIGSRSSQSRSRVY